MWLGGERPIDRRKPLAHCPRCSSRLIYAVDAVGFGSEVILDRRCPECEYRGCATASALAVAVWYRRDTRILGGLQALADALALESSVDDIVESGDRPGLLTVSPNEEPWSRGRADTARLQDEIDEDATRPERGSLPERRAGGPEIGRPAREQTGPAEEAADVRDRAAERRDRGAERRDAIARLLDEAGESDSTLASLLLHAERDRARAAADRAHASDDRSRASLDRMLAAQDRSDALEIRAEAASNLKLAATDGLTGVWTRKFGLEAAARELDRARRTGHAFVLAFIDVDGLKRVNDVSGHLAGDALLRSLGEILHASLRPYDVTVRYGGDEFVSVMSQITLHEARARLDGIAGALAATGPDHSFSFGLAEAEQGEELEAVIARADADLLAHRHFRRERDSA